MITFHLRQRRLCEPANELKLPQFRSQSQLACIMPLRKAKFNKNIQVGKNGSGRVFFVSMTFVAFVISGVLEGEPVFRTRDPPPSREVSRPEKSSGRRYCDPPNMTALAIYYDSSEEKNVDDDYELWINQETFFQSNFSESDRLELEEKIISDWGTLLSFVPACFLGAEFGPQKVFGYCALALTAVTYLVPFILTEAAIVIRQFLIGIMSFSFYEMAFHLISKGRNTVISFISGKYVGLALSELLETFFLNENYVKYVMIAITALWFLVWSRIHFQFSRSEVLYLKRKNAKATTPDPRFPWRAVLLSRPVWMTTAAIFGLSCGISSIFKAMRLYLKYIYFIPVEGLSAMSGAFHFGFAVACGKLVDCLQESRIVSITSSRRMVVYVSHFIPAGFLFVLGFLGCSPITPIVFYCLAVTATGAAYSGALSSPLDLAPKYTGPILAMCFTIGSAGFLFMDYLTAYVLTEEVMVSWRFIFSLNSLILLVTAIFFMLRGSGSIQPWNDPNHMASQDNRNQQGRMSVIAPLPTTRTKSIYTVEKKILKVLYVQEPDKFTRVRAYSTSLPSERCASGPANVYKPHSKKRASIS